MSSVIGRKAGSDFHIDIWKARIDVGDCWLVKEK